MTLRHFNVYPKKSNEVIKVEISRFTLRDESFVVYNSGKQATSNFAFIAKDKVAAIAPAEPRDESRFRYLIDFLVYLREHKEPLVIRATRFKEQSPEFCFYSSTGGSDVKIDDVYIDGGEVITVIPAQGLQMYFDDVSTGV